MVVDATRKATAKTCLHHSVAHVISNWLTLRYELAVSPGELIDLLVSFCPANQRRGMEVPELVSVWNEQMPPVPTLASQMMLLSISLVQKELAFQDISEHFLMAGRGPSLVLSTVNERFPVIAIDYIDQEILVLDPHSMIYRHVDEGSYATGYVIIPEISRAFTKRGGVSDQPVEVVRWPSLVDHLGLEKAAAECPAPQPEEPEPEKPEPEKPEPEKPQRRRRKRTRSERSSSREQGADAESEGPPSPRLQYRARFRGFPAAVAASEPVTLESLKALEPQDAPESPQAWEASEAPGEPEALEELEEPEEPEEPEALEALEEPEGPEEPEELEAPAAPVAPAVRRTSKRGPREAAQGKALRPPKDEDQAGNESCSCCGTYFKDMSGSAAQRRSILVRMTLRLPDRRPFMRCVNEHHGGEAGYPVCYRCYRTHVNVYRCSGCGQDRAIVSRSKTRLDFMMKNADRDSSGFPICNICYRQHVNSAPCSGCGKTQPVCARVMEEEPWMIRSTLRGNAGNHAVCSSCYQRFLLKAPCAGCGHKRVVASRLAKREKWMQLDAGDKTSAPSDVGYPVCKNCYRVHVPTGKCSGCNKDKALVASVRTQEKWMKPGAVKSNNGYPLCHVCYQKHVYHRTCSGCGHDRPVAMVIGTKLTWMQQGIQKEGSGFSICKPCAKAHVAYFQPEIDARA